MIKIYLTKVEDFKYKNDISSFRVELKQEELKQLLKCTEKDSPLYNKISLILK